MASNGVGGYCAITQFDVDSSISNLLTTFA